MTIGPRIQQRVSRDFPDPGSASGLLRLLDDLAQDSDEHMFGAERLQAAVVLLADGSVSRFHQALALTKIDWRDVLVAAGLATDDWPARLDQELGPTATGSATEDPASPH